MCFWQTVILGSYLIAHGFFSVYGMCVDTLFLCFCKSATPLHTPTTQALRATISFLSLPSR